MSPSQNGETWKMKREKRKGIDSLNSLEVTAVEEEVTMEGNAAIIVTYLFVYISVTRSSN